MRRFSQPMAALLSFAFIVACALPAFAKHHSADSNNTSSSIAPVSSGHNPLLPAPIAIEALWPDLAMAQKTPTVAPDGLAPNYSTDEWAAYRAQFGAAADDVLRKRSSQVAQFAQELMSAAAKTDQPGLKRLLLMRATIMTYRATAGNAVAQKALAAYQDVIDLKSPTQVAALWTMADGLARQISTPKSDRPKFGTIAARANIQLCMLLLDLNQVAAAESIAKLLGRHEGAIRADAALHAQANNLRNLVSQTSAMFDYLHTQYDLLARGNDSGTLPLYIYGRLVKLNPQAASALAAHRNNPTARQLDLLFQQATHDPLANYPLAESLKATAATLPDGILKHRVLYAALQSYRAFLSAPQTDSERVKRTMSRMAIQTVAADGATPNPIIRPFDKPAIPTVPATLAATTMAQG